jgi:hypothetical protein
MMRFLLLAVLFGGLSDARQDDRVERLKWMSGCWLRATPRFTMEEQWTVPRAGTMFGIGRTTRRLVSADSVSEHEFTQIHVVQENSSSPLIHRDRSLRTSLKRS